jgi:cell division protein FtsL
MLKKKRKSYNKSPHKSKRRPIHYLIILGAMFFVYVFFLSNHGLLKYYQLLRRREQLVKQINQLKQDQNQLQQEIDLLSNNYRYIEKIAREKYQMGKKGEKIYIITSPDKNK